VIEDDEDDENLDSVFDDVDCKFPDCPIEVDDDDEEEDEEEVDYSDEES